MNSNTVATANISDEELALINSFSKKELKKDEIYTFSVNLCDNEIDRDNECFSDEALESLAKFFVGKTAICDHSMKTENQIARTYYARVESVSGKLNSLGKPYKVLKAKAYMPKTDKNKTFIEEIEAGIKKEVSISCSARSRTCSICGRQLGSSECHHASGRVYSGKKCYALLSDIADAYEWSFVAVPAQKNAAVVKSYKISGDKNMKQTIKSFSEAQGDITLSKEQAREIYSYVKELENKAQGADVYKNEKISQIKKLSAVVLPSLKAESAQAILGKSSLEELMEIEKALKEKAEEIMPISVQLAGEKTSGAFDGTDYSI